jgi:hypothetical protein
MLSNGLQRTDRRTAIGATFAVATGLAIQIPTRGRVLTQRGMIGGGVVQVGQNAAGFSLYATRFAVAEENWEVVTGSILWSDPTLGITLESTDVTVYEVVEGGSGETRRIEGMMTLGGEETYPFVMVVADVGDPSSGQDTISFGVGDGVTVGGDATPVAGLGFSYAAAGPIAGGDVQLVEIDADTETGSATAAPPEA